MNLFTGSTLGITLLLTFAQHCYAQTPEWIWHDNKGVAPGDNEVRFFRKTFSVGSEVTKAIVSVAGDDQAVAFLNGKQVAASRSWNKAVRTTVTPDIRQGENLLAIRAQNSSGDAAVILKIDLTLANNQKQTIVSDPSWVSSTQGAENWQTRDFNAASWTKVVSRGKLGVQPWGDVMSPPVTTPAESLTVLPGFKAELIKASEPGEGSWICMTFDQKGRVIISPQSDNEPLLRISLTDKGQVAKTEAVPAKVRQAMGFLYAHDSLYVNGHGPQGTGLYRLIDANKNDQFETDEVRLLKNFKGEGEHGYHGLALGPDNLIYIMNGNHTKVPDGVAAESPLKNYAEDMLLPRQWDAGGHAVGILAPGGYVVRTDAEGKKWELMLAGFRNAYDLDFNADGELFTFDSDMEWDWGMPWYKPTAVFHCVTGADYGWRSGTGNWPWYYPDALPPAVEIGIGSPTGVKFGTKSNFPDKYRKAFYILDWSYGRVIAVHLRPDGATYSGGFESFVKGKPLNVADIEFGPDGAMYFITGGRGTQSGLYRVSYVGGRVSTDLAEGKRETGRELRKKLEAYHGKKDPRAIDFAWPHLSSSDRWIRYAARVAIEWQDVSLWKDRALSETNADAALTALLALARSGSAETQSEIATALARFPLDSLTEERKLAKLRVIQLMFIRQGRPDGALAQRAIDKLDRQFSSPSERLNRELSQLLIYLEAPGVVEKCLRLMESATTQEEQIHYLFHLRTLKSGWTMEQRRRYFDWWNKDRAGVKHPPELIQWFADVGRDYQDGASFMKFLANFKKDAVANLTETDRAELAEALDTKVAATPKPAQRSHVQEWKLAELLPELDKASNGRSFTRGRQAFIDAQCLACHKFGNEGGASGPELTAAASKYSRRDILEAIIEPSKVVSEQYQNSLITFKDGERVLGRIVDDKPDKLVLEVDPLTQIRKEIRKGDIQKREPSTISPMPDGLANVLTKEEIFDLLAYIESGGRRRHAAFSRN